MTRALQAENNYGRTKNEFRAAVKAAIKKVRKKMSWAPEGSAFETSTEAVTFRGFSGISTIGESGPHPISIFGAGRIAESILCGEFRGYEPSA